jgi:hypothetical protein
VAPGETMLCGSCGAVNKVKFPTAKTRGQIEGILGKRPPENQNWKTELVSELEAENIERGIW